MVKHKAQISYLPDGNIDLDQWISSATSTYQLPNPQFLNEVCNLTQSLTTGLTTFYGKSCLALGLEVAEVLLDLGLDQETAASGILSTAVSLTPSTEEKIKNTLGESTVRLMKAVHQMDVLVKQQIHHASQIDKLRKMLLAIAVDIRAVIVKLAERLTTMRGIKSIPPEERKKIAQEILDIYAPLANRLGIGQLKWELEDLAFHYLDPTTYKTIANFLAERRSDREKNIHRLIEELKIKLKGTGIHADVTGRAKHIYSIYLKSQRKTGGYEEIYDYSAVRILVNTLEDCYTVLSIVHSLWPPIMQEFDDYIANPKPNGYRSIHTAVIGENGKHFEIQIRTHYMHDEAERGVAAHWLYKEKKGETLDDTAKISYLRQLLDWHKEIAKPNEQMNVNAAPVLDDQVYVITPNGDIIDLPHGSTPLDFAYHIHSELGHRCRGAKVNGQIVPLTYTLRTGDKIEVSTILQGAPSRDWLNPELGYLKTSRARSKVSHWFKQQAMNEDIAAGRQVLEREFSRHAIAKTMSLQTIAKHFQLKDEDALLASLGRGNVRIGQILQFVQPKPVEKPILTPPIIKSTTETKRTAAIAGASDFLTRMAKCCKPIPGDAIIGYITQGRGISIHKRTCNNMKHVSDPHRFIEINWDKEHLEMFNTDLKIVAMDKTSILSDLTSLFVNEKINLLNFNSTFNKHVNRLIIFVTVQIQSLEQLNKLLHRLQQLPGVIEVNRVVQ